MSIAAIEAIFVTHVIDNINSFNIDLSGWDSNINIQYPGGPSKTPNGLPWLALTNTTLNNFNKDANSSGQHTSGIFTIAVNYPPEQGSFLCNATADSIVSFFYNNPPEGIYLVDIIARPQYGKSWTTVNVLITYDYPSDSLIGGVPVYSQ